MREPKAIGLAVVLAMATGLILMGLAEPALHAAPHRQAPAQSPCLADVQNTVVPRILLLGETTLVTLRVRFLCPPEAQPLHLVLVLDASGSMAGDPNRQLQEAARTLIDGLELRDNPATLVGVVEFESSARTLCPLTNFASRARSCASRVSAQGGTCIDCGFREGLKVLIAGRRQVPADPAPSEVMVVLSDGANNDGCTPVLAAARQVKSQGVLVVTVCLGDACDLSCLRAAASSLRYAFQARDASELTGIFESIRRDVTRESLKQLTVVDALPALMPLVDGSAVPEPTARQGGALVWEFEHLPMEGVTLSFRLRPGAIGDLQTSLGAGGTFLDAGGRAGRFGFPMTASSVTVLQPLPLPTDAPASPTPSALPTGPGSSPTPIPSPTARPRPWLAFLPRLDRGWTPRVTP